MTRDDLIADLKTFFGKLDGEGLPEGGVAERLLCHLRDNNLAVVPKSASIKATSLGSALILKGEGQHERSITAGNIYYDMVADEDLADRKPG